MPTPSLLLPLPLGGGGNTINLSPLPFGKGGD